MSVGERGGATGSASSPPRAHVRPTGHLATRFVGPAVIVGLGALLAWGPFKWPCPLMTVLGVPCPTCGMTRAVRLAIHGDVAAATAMHPLWAPVLAALAVVIAIEVAGFARAGAWGASASHAWVRRGAPMVVGALVVVWLARFAGALGGPVAAP